MIYLSGLAGLALLDWLHLLVRPLPDVIMAGSAALIVAWLSARKRRTRLEERRQRERLRTVPYSDAELNWVRSCPTRELDLMLVVDETLSARGHLDSIRYDLTELIGALKTTSVQLRVGVATYKDQSPGRLLPLNSDQEAVLESIQGIAYEESAAEEFSTSLGSGWDEVLTADWRPAAQRRAVWLGTAVPAGARGQVFAQSCREMGIVLHTVACRAESEATRELFAQLALLTGGQCLCMTDAWLLLPLLVSGRRDANTLAIETYVAEELALQRAEETWNEVVRERRKEGFVERWVSSTARGPAKIDFCSSWKVDTPAVTLEVLQQDGSTFTVRAEADDQSLYTRFSLAHELLKQHHLDEEDRVLVRPRCERGGTAG